jgi:hypothetical protein
MNLLQENFSKINDLTPGKRDIAMVFQNSFHTFGRTAAEVCPCQGNGKAAKGFSYG